jgi:hypothetical protein
MGNALNFGDLFYNWLRNLKAYVFVGVDELLLEKPLQSIPFDHCYPDPL